MGRAQRCQRSLNQCGSCQGGQNFPIMWIHVLRVTETHKPMHTHKYLERLTQIKFTKSKPAMLKSYSVYTHPTLSFVFLLVKEKCVPLTPPLVGENRSEAVAVLLVASSMQDPSPTVTMPTCVRRRFSCRPKETWWGPGIISSSLWSPVNRPTSSRSHKGERNGEHTGSELTSKKSAHFLDHTIQRRGKSGEKVLLSIHTYKYSS